MDRWEAWGTVFSISMAMGDSVGRNHILEASGRLNFQRPIQNFDVYMSQFRPHMILLRYTLSDQFTIKEQDEEFFFKPSNERWLIVYRNESFELTDEDVLQIVLGNVNIKDILLAQKAEDLINEESKKALSVLSDMYVKNVFNEKTFEEVKRYAEEAKDERVKDMLKIVERRFRKMPYSNGQVKIKVIE